MKTLVLVFLVDCVDIVYFQKSIAAAMWHKCNVNDSTLKHSISTVRRKIQQAVLNIDVSLILQTDEQGCMWENYMEGLCTATVWKAGYNFLTGLFLKFD